MCCVGVVPADLVCLVCSDFAMAATAGSMEAALKVVLGLLDSSPALALLSAAGVPPGRGPKAVRGSVLESVSPEKSNLRFGVATAPVMPGGGDPAPSGRSGGGGAARCATKAGASVTDASLGDFDAISCFSRPARSSVSCLIMPAC